MRPDVTLISPYPRLGTRHDGDSGVASYTANLAHALVAEGANVCVIAPELRGEPRTSHDGRIEIRRQFRTQAAGAIPAAFAAAEDTGAAVTHLQHELFLYSGAAGLPATVATLAARRARGRRTVITMHQVVDPAAVDRRYTAMHRVRVPAPAARVAIAAIQQLLPRLADQVLVHEPAFQAVIPRAAVVPHGIEIPPATGEAVGTIRRRLGLPEDQLIALCFGFLAPYKGLETALAAAELTGRAVRLVVAGGAHPRLAAQGDDYAGRLVQRYGGVATFTGYVPDQQVSDWFRAADVALLCYPEPHASSGPLALALAHRTPVLLSRRLVETVGAPADLAVDTEPVDWARRLDALAAEPERRAGLQSQVDALAADRTWPTVARRHLGLYQEVTHADRPAAADLALA